MLQTKMLFKKESPLKYWKNILPRYVLAPKTALFVDTKLCKNNDDVVVVEVREMIAALPWVIVICMKEQLAIAHQ